MNKRLKKIPFDLANANHYSQVVCLLLLIALANSVMAKRVVARTVEDVQSSSREVVIPKGTAFEVLTTNEMFSSTVLEGEPVYFKVADDVVVDGVVVIAKGTTVEGSVSEATLGGRYGATGKLTVEVGSTTTVDGQTIRLNGYYSKRGKLNVAAVGALYAALGVLGPVMYHGKSAHVPAGTKIKVSTASEKRVHVRTNAS
ncbi:MAG TPA: hypothetical protein VK619_14020 [Pyrinomonadaceae bacterium]|nr:hypothetical protein [Pyrinomonadaceae bacterium]